jgi:hypothetical protein
MRAPTKEIPELSEKFLIKFNSLINKNCDNGCHEWMGAICLGYGVIRLKMNPGSSTFRAHRISYFLHNQSISTSLMIDHKCRNRKCVNPDHLREVTNRINSIENNSSVTYFNHKKECCNRGHVFDEKNTRVLLNGRGCRECERIRKRQYRARKKCK